MGVTCRACGKATTRDVGATWTRFSAESGGPALPLRAGAAGGPPRVDARLACGRRAPKEALREAPRAGLYGRVETGKRGRRSVQAACEVFTASGGRWLCPYQPLAGHCSCRTLPTGSRSILERSLARARSCDHTKRSIRLPTRPCAINLERSMPGGVSRACGAFHSASRRPLHERLGTLARPEAVPHGRSRGGTTLDLVASAARSVAFTPGHVRRRILGRSGAPAASPLQWCPCPCFGAKGAMSTTRPMALYPAWFGCR